MLTRQTREAFASPSEKEIIGSPKGAGCFFARNVRQTREKVLRVIAKISFWRRGERFVFLAMEIIL
jgi:hypothetical protein